MGLLGSLGLPDIKTPGGGKTSPNTPVDPMTDQVPTDPPSPNRADRFTVNDAAPLSQVNMRVPRNTPARS